MKAQSIVYHIVFPCLFLAISSCSKYGSQTEKILKLSGENRSELETVLKHYEGDKQKQEAARFLICNMPGSYSVNPDLIKECLPFYESYDSLLQEYHHDITGVCGNKIDTLWTNFQKSHHLSSGSYSDLANIKATTLIQEIDLAFQAWEGNVYSRQCSFIDFCEYILPYRRLNGLLADDSRTEFYNRHHQKYFSNQGKEWLQEVDSLLYDYHHLSHSKFRGTEIPIWNVDTFEKLRHGLCIHRCWFNSLLLSSLGMPVAIDFVPSWGNRNNSHTWNVLVMDGKSYAFEAFWDVDRWKYKWIYNNRTKDEHWGRFRLPKVYRNTYSNHIEGPVSDPKIDKGDIPQLFLNVKKKDVSSEYFETTDVTVALTSGNPRNESYAYLSVFNYQHWTPVQWGRIKDGVAVFEKMGKEIVYLPVYYKQGKLSPAAEPFMLTSNGEVVKLMPQIKKQSLSIRQTMGSSGYGVNREYVGCMRGLKIQGMRDGQPESILSVWNDSLSLERAYKEVQNVHAYRYIRLHLPSDSIVLGELAFYTADGRIKNVKLITPLPTTNINETPLMLVDGLDATAYRGKVKKKVVDIDLGQEYRITRIGIAPYVKTELGCSDVWELNYWDNGWRPIERKTAGGRGFLNFDNVPKGALYLLKNPKWGKHSGERIFTYDDGSVRWM